MSLVETRVPSPRLETPDGGSGRHDETARFGLVPAGYIWSVSTKFEEVLV